MRILWKRNEAQLKLLHELKPLTFSMFLIALRPGLMEIRMIFSFATVLHSSMRYPEAEQRVAVAHFYHVPRGRRICSAELWGKPYQGMNFKLWALEAAGQTPRQRPQQHS